MMLVYFPRNHQHVTVSTYRVEQPTSYRNRVGEPRSFLHWKL